MESWKIHLVVVYTTYKNGDDWGILGDGLWHCFNHIMMIIMWCFYGIIMGWLSMGYSDFNMIIMIIMWWCVFLIKWWWLSWLRCGDHFYDYNGFIIENYFFDVQRSWYFSTAMFDYRKVTHKHRGSCRRMNEDRSYAFSVGSFQSSRLAQPTGWCI